MRIALIIAMSTILASSITPARADEDKMTAEQFTQQLARVIRVIADRYYYEIDSGELLRWAVNGLYERRNKIVPDEIAERLEKASNPDRKEVKDVLTAVAGDSDDDLRWCADIACERLLGRLDGRTELHNHDFILYGISPRGDIGVRVATDAKTRLPRVVYPYRNGAAYKAGIRSGDVITEIRRLTGNVSSPVKTVSATAGMSITQVNQALRGRAGTEVTLEIRRNGAPELLTFTMTREAAEEESVFGVRRTPDDRWDHCLDAQRQVGYLRLSRFVPPTHDEFSRALDTLQQQGAKGLVLDLRRCEGGLIDTGTKIAATFLGDAPLYTIRSRGQKEPFDGREGVPAGIKTLKIPVACLVDGKTNKMSEVVAACLQDNKRSIIIGERTAGNTYLSSLLRVGSGQLLRVTCSVFYSPNGKKLDRIHPPGKPSDEWGVTPDKGFELALTAKERDQLRAHFENQLVIPPPGQAKEQAPAFKDRQLEMAVEYLRSKIRSGQANESS